jgi:hypothetical protein
MKTSLRLLLLAVFAVLFVGTASAHYNPQLGRWLSRDPMGEAGGFNLYAYCGNDPVNRHDPLGLASTFETDQQSATFLSVLLPFNYARIGGGSMLMYNQPLFGSASEDIGYTHALGGQMGKTALQGVFYGSAGLRVGGGALEIFGGAYYSVQTGGVGGIAGGGVMAWNGYDNMKAGVRTIYDGEYRQSGLESFMTDALGPRWGAVGYMGIQLAIGGIPLGSRLLGPKLAPRWNLANYQWEPALNVGGAKLRYTPRNAGGWQVYEQMVRGLYSSTSVSTRQFQVVIDGKLLSGVADNVVSIGGKRIAIEAKYVDAWVRSLRNPSSPIGAMSFSLDEQANMLLQARKYSSAFDEVIYHSNSQELISYYEAIFKQHGLGNVRFIFTP